MPAQRTHNTIDNPHHYRDGKTTCKSLCQKMRLGTITATFFTLLLGGCATNMQGGVGPLGSPKAAQIVDLVDELYTRAGKAVADGECTTRNSPKTPDALELSSTTAGSSNEGQQWKSSNIPSTAGSETRCLTKAYFALEEKLKAEPSSAIGVRNSLQDRLITASDQSCSLFKKYLNSTQSSTNFLAGSAALVLGAAASSVTSAEAAKNFTTGALIASGLSAQFNADMLSSQMTFAIVKAIDVERERALQKLRKERSTQSLDDYGLSAAIGDALRYHDICSLPAGLAALDKSITIVSDPGLKHIANIFPSGKWTVKDGVFTAENVATGNPQFNGSMEVAGSVLPVLAERQFADAIKNLESERQETVKRLETEKKEEFKARVEQLGKKATQVSCAWDGPTIGPKFSGEDEQKSKAICYPDTFLNQVCNSDGCKSPSSRGLVLARELGTSLYDSYHGWLRETKINPGSNSVNARRAAYEIAWASHQAYIKNFLQPAIAWYKNELGKIENGTLAGGSAPP